MRPTFFISSALFCLTVLAAHADPTSDARKAIQAAYNREDAAAARRDTTGVLADETSDFVSISVKGKTETIDEKRPIYAKMFAAAKSAKGTTRIQSIVLKDGGAVVVIQESVMLVVVDPQTGKTRTLASSGKARDFWVKTGGTWKCKRSRELTARTTLDGHLMPQQ